MGNFSRPIAEEKRYARLDIGLLCAAATPHPSITHAVHCIYPAIRVCGLK